MNFAVFYWARRKLWKLYSTKAAKDHEVSPELPGQSARRSHGPEEDHRFKNREQLLQEERSQ